LWINALCFNFSQIYAIKLLNNEHFPKTWKTIDLCFGYSTVIENDFQCWLTVRIIWRRLWCAASTFKMFVFLLLYKESYGAWFWKLLCLMLSLATARQSAKRRVVALLSCRHVANNHAKRRVVVWRVVAMSHCRSPQIEKLTICIYI
jgi:hypothetical protein